MWSKQQLKCNVDLPPNERSLYYQVLSKEYDLLKEMCKTYWMVKSDTAFSEDVFHDTMINCVNACCTMTTRAEIYRYFCKAYATNMIRETKYVYRSKEVPMKPYDDYEDIRNESFESFRHEVYEYVANDKGERIANIIHDYVDGHTYDELVEKYQIKNIHKKAPALKLYMKEIIESWEKF